MSSASERLAKQAKEMKKDVEELGETARDAAQEKLPRLRDKASAYGEQGRDKVHGLACASEQFIRARPLRSVLMGAGIGWLFGRFWKRR